MVEALPPLEASAKATSEERFDGGYAAVTGARSTAEFERKYEKLLNNLIAAGNWKAIYEEKQKRWETWISDNNFEDRASLKTVTPRPEWRQAMGG